MNTTEDGRGSGWSIALGIVLVLVGLLVLGNAMLATIVSIYFIGWAAVIGGVVLVVQAIARRQSGGFWSVALGGAVLLVLGVFVLRNPAIGLVTVTVLAGALFLVAGVVRIAVALPPEPRWLLVISGVISVVLGLWVLLNVTTASVLLLGVLLGIQTLLEGVTVLMAGSRPARGTVSPSQPTGAPA